MTFEEFEALVSDRARQVADEVNADNGRHQLPLIVPSVRAFMAGKYRGVQVDYTRPGHKGRPDIQHTDFVLFDPEAGQFVAARTNKKGAVTVLKTQPKTPVTLDNFRFLGGCTGLRGINKGWVRWATTSTGSTTIYRGEIVSITHKQEGQA